MTIQRHPSFGTWLDRLLWIHHRQVSDARTVWDGFGYDSELITATPAGSREGPATEDWYIVVATSDGDACADVPADGYAVTVECVPDALPFHGGFGTFPHHLDLLSAHAGPQPAVGSCGDVLFAWNWDDGNHHVIPAIPSQSQPATITNGTVVMAGADGYINDPPGPSSGITQPFQTHSAAAIVAGETYRLTAKLRDQVSGGGAVNIRWLDDIYDGSTRNILSQEADLVGTGGTGVLSTVSADYVAPVGAIGIQIGAGGNTHVSELSLALVS